MSLINIPSRTLIWTPEYPLVTFLTLLITFDILAAESGGSTTGVCSVGGPDDLRQGGNASLFG